MKWNEIHIEREKTNIFIDLLAYIKYIEQDKNTVKINTHFLNKHSLFLNDSLNSTLSAIWISFVFSFHKWFYLIFSLMKRHQYCKFYRTVNCIIRKRWWCIHKINIEQEQKYIWNKHIKICWINICLFLNDRWTSSRDMFMHSTKSASAMTVYGSDGSWSDG